MKAEETFCADSLYLTNKSDYKNINRFNSIFKISEKEMELMEMKNKDTIFNTKSTFTIFIL